jgi:hypothetical protein
MAPGPYANKDSDCIPVCPKGLVINPIKAGARCLQTGWDMEQVSNMHCDGWWSEQDESSVARKLTMSAFACVYIAALVTTMVFGW